MRRMRRPTLARCPPRPASESGAFAWDDRRVPMKVRTSLRSTAFVLGRPMTIARLRPAACLVTALFSFHVAAQQTLPPPLEGGPPSDVPVAVQILRWHMLDGNVNALMFRSMDSLFTTRTVARSGDVWRLPRSDHALDFSYTWQ